MRKVGRLSIRAKAEITTKTKKNRKQLIKQNKLNEFCVVDFFVCFHQFIW